jgi:hypothetical protein
LGGENKGQKGIKKRAEGEKVKREKKLKRRT